MQRHMKAAEHVSSQAQEAPAGGTVIDNALYVSIDTAVQAVRGGGQEHSGLRERRVFSEAAPASSPSSRPREDNKVPEGYQADPAFAQGLDLSGL